MAELLGQSREELVGKELWEIGLAKDAEASRAAFRQLKEKGYIRYQDLPLCSKTGEARELEFVSNAYDENGHAVIQCNIRDVTERKRAEKAIREARLDWECTFNSVPDLIAVLDQQNRVRRVNRALAERLNRNPQDCVGQLCYECIHGIPYAPDFCPHALCLQDGQCHTTEVHELLLQGDFLVSTTPLRDEQGSLIGTVHISRDISMRKRAEEALKNSEKRYRTLFDAIDEGFCIIEMIFDENEKTVDYRFLETNPSFERQTGFTAAQGKRIRELFPQLEEHWFEIYGKIALTGQPARFQNRAEQMHRWFDVYAFRIGEPDNHQVAILFSDITERKNAETKRMALIKEVQSINQELNDFASIVSHDLRAPLRGVATLASWLQSDYADKLNDQGRDYLAQMNKRVGRMDRMIEGILDYSRLGRTIENPERLELAKVLPGVVEDLAPPPRVHVQIAPGFPAVYGQSVRLRQLFQNLIGNAIKHADKPEVEIGVNWADSGSAWEFSVTDNGPGIEERHFERIFKIFQTLAPKDKTDSTGIGLALVKRIAERAGGRIWVESRLGEGSTFHVVWPKAPQSVQKSDSAQESHLTTSGARERSDADLSLVHD